MAQLTLYIDDETAKQLDEAAARAGLSRSAWAKAAIKQQLQRKFPREWYELWGSWEDERSADEILRNIRIEAPQREREPLD